VTKVTLINSPSDVIGQLDWHNLKTIAMPKTRLKRIKKLVRIEIQRELIVN